jgi:hypothetical protein
MIARHGIVPAVRVRRKRIYKSFNLQTFMEYSKTFLIQAYLDKKGIKYQRAGKELVAHCIFNECDKDSRGREAHLYFSAETGQYQCKKCLSKGNITTLMKHFGDYIEKPAKKNPSFNLELIEQCHSELPVRIRQYLKDVRGLTDEVINDRKLGYGFFYGQTWITIPIKLPTGEYTFFKLRQDPANGNDKRTYPKGTDNHPVSAQIYEWDVLRDGDGPIVLCEGEFDRLLLQSKGINAVNSWSRDFQIRVGI